MTTAPSADRSSATALRNGDPSADSPPAESISLFVVDDHEVVRTGLVAAFTTESGIDVIGSAANGAEALTEVDRLRPDLALVDYRLPDMTGAELCERLRVLSHPPRVVVLSTYLSEQIVRNCLAAGADAFVTKAAGLAELKREIRSVASRTARPTDAPRVVARLNRLMHSTLDQGATPQQVAVVRLAALGMTNREIGAKLYITEATVRYHLQAMKRRLGAKNKVELVALAIRHGLIEANEDLEPARTDKA